MDTKHLNDVQIIAHVGQLLLQQRFDELGAAACSDERVLRQLASILRQAQPPSFMFAGVALSKAGAPAIPALLEALGDGQFPVRQMAGLALGDIGDPRTVASLVQALGDPQAVVRQAAAHALGKIGVADAVEPLLACLADESDQVRNAAYRIIAGKGATYYGIGSALARVTNVILRDQRAILTVCTPQEEVAGVRDVTVALPNLVGGAGVISTCPFPLSDEEHAALRASAQIVREAIASLDGVSA